VLDAAVDRARAELAALPARDRRRLALEVLADDVDR
jgi:hypothetical protein